MSWLLVFVSSVDFYWRCLEDIDYSGLKEPYRNTIRNYVERGLPPGDALRHALEGSIKALLCFQDPVALGSLVRWVHQTLPAPLWGSRRKVRTWMRLARRASLRSSPSARCTGLACKSEFTAAAL